MNSTDLQQLIETALPRFSNTAGACLYQSALLTALINDNTSEQALLRVGSLTIRHIPIFGYEPLQKNDNYLQSDLSEWDGHAWVEVNGYLCDTSLFSTVRNQKTPLAVRNLIDSMFSNDISYLIGNHRSLSKIGIKYTPQDELDDGHITQLIQSGHKLGMFNLGT